MASSARGSSAEGHVDRLLSAASVMERGRLHWHQHHPPIRGGQRAESGLSDREVLWGGRAYMLEIKEETGTSAALGCLTKPLDGKRPTHGITWQQAVEFDLHTVAVVPCFVAVALSVPAKPPTKAGGPGSGREAQTIRRIIPWAAWRALMVRAEDQRESLARWQIESGRLMLRNGPTCPIPPRPEVDASIPAADLAAMGHPLETAADLLAAFLANGDAVK